MTKIKSKSLCRLHNKKTDRKKGKRGKGLNSSEFAKERKTEHEKSGKSLILCRLTIPSSFPIIQKRQRSHSIWMIPFFYFK